MSELRPTKTREAEGRVPARERWYWRLRRWMTPGLRNAQYAYFAALDDALGPGDRWLDLGCGRRIAPHWLRHGGRIERSLIERAGEVVGIDPDVNALADNTLPIIKRLGYADSIDEPDGGFDLITANMVVEHLDRPEAVLREAARLLRPGGVLLFHTPNRAYPLIALASLVPQGLRSKATAWLEKREPCDIYPTRYRLNRARTVRRLAERSGLEVVSLTLTADSPETVGLGPLVAAELALIALTRTRLLARWRSNLVVTLRKPLPDGTRGDVLLLRAAAQPARPAVPGPGLGEAA